MIQYLLGLVGLVSVRHTRGHTRRMFLASIFVVFRLGKAPPDGKR